MMLKQKQIQEIVCINYNNDFNKIVEELGQYDQDALILAKKYYDEIQEDLFQFFTIEDLLYE